MTTALLRASSVSRRFGDVLAVDDVSMHVEAGEVVGLLGANGAGKTTLIRMLLGLLGTSAGTVEVLGGRPDRARRRRLGYVPQNLGLYRDLTVDENLPFVAGAYGAAKPAVPDGWVPLVFIRLLDVARRVPNFTGKGNPPWTCTDVDLNDAVEQCDEYLKAALGVGK